MGRINLLMAPVFNLRTNPGNRARTQKDLLREVTSIHQPIDTGFRKTGHLFDLRQANKVAAIVGHKQKAKDFEVGCFLSC